MPTTRRGLRTRERAGVSRCVCVCVCVGGCWGGEMLLLYSNFLLLKCPLGGLVVGRTIGAASCQTRCVVQCANVRFNFSRARSLAALSCAYVFV